MTNEVPINKLSYLFLGLWTKLNSKRKHEFWFIVFLSVLCSFVELLSIGAIVPFLLALSDPNLALSYLPFISELNIFKGLLYANWVLFFSIVFVFLIVVSSLIRLYLVWVSNKFAFSIGIDLGKTIFFTLLNQPYEFYKSKNSSEFVTEIITKINFVIHYVVLPGIHLISALIILIIIFSALLAINVFVTITLTLSFIMIYSLVIWVVRKFLIANSDAISVSSNLIVKNLQETFASIKEVILLRKQSFFIENFHKNDINLRKSQAINSFLNSSPRFVVEAIGVAIILFFAWQGGVVGKSGPEIIAYIGLFAFIAQKSLPLMQQIYSSYAHIMGSYKSFDDVVSTLNKKVKKTPKKIKLISFDHSLIIKNLSFKYDGESEMIIDNLNLTINKGESIGVVGKTGSGKSTLVDILMGLLTPVKGGLFVDNKKINGNSLYGWWKNISLVPQHIFLTDNTFIENIAFGVDKKDIDIKRVHQVSKHAEIYSFIIGLKDGFHSSVGESGAKLSGGQRQRIAIARALYKNSALIVLDEATSALDKSTERSIMKTIRRFYADRTLIIISHNKSILKDCSAVYQTENRKLIQIKYPKS